MNFLVNLFFGPIHFKGISFVKLKVSTIFAGNGGNSNSREYLWKRAFFNGRDEKWSEVKKWRVFGLLFFFNFRYIKVGVMGNNNIDIKKCTTIFLWVLNLEQVGEIFKNFQNHTATMIFSKMVSNLSVLAADIWGNLRMIFFLKKNLKGFLL